MSQLVTEPGIIADLSDDAYHGDTGSLSSSGARRLLEVPPARWVWERDHARRPVKAFDLGHAFHSEVLGIGKGVIVPTDGHGAPLAEWRTDHAKAQVVAARDAGAVPLKPGEAAQVRAMAAAVRAHPLAGRLFAEGVAEQSAFVTDPDTGVWLRARPDWTTTLGGRVVLVDLKSTLDASLPAWRKTIENYGYHMQDPFYRSVYAALGVDVWPLFLFVLVEKDPPHLVAVREIEADDVDLGHARNRRAIDLYARCVESGEWPGYPPTVESIRLPPWAAA